jgi:hypothetical protein
VRLEGAAESALIDRELDMPASAADWLERDIVDITDSEVVEVEIVHPDGERIVTRKASADDTDFELQDIPEGREIRSAWTVNSLANSLAALTLDDVAAEDTVDWGGAARFGLLTADGLRVDVDLVASETADGPEGDADEPAGDEEAEHWIRLRAEVHQTGVDSAAESPEAEGDDQAVETPDDPAEVPGSEGSAEVPADETSSDDPAARASEINQRVSGWAYRIPKYKFDAMNKRMEDLLLAIEDPDA